jgi:hypothetical protein
VTRNARAYICQVAGCNKRFARGEHLKRHVRSIHTNEKRMFECQRHCVRELTRLISIQMRLSELWEGVLAPRQPAPAPSRSQRLFGPQRRSLRYQRAIRSQPYFRFGFPIRQLTVIYPQTPRRSFVRTIGRGPASLRLHPPTPLP